MAELTRIQKLTGRVRWLDRHRRVLAIGISIALAPLMLFELEDVLGSEWPRAHVAMTGAMLGVMLWWVIEVVLVWLTAVWETECDRLMRDRGMPPARIVHRK